MRHELAAQYAKLAEANARRDLKEILELRAADFSSAGADGKGDDTQHDAEYVRQLVSGMEPPIRLINIIIDGKRIDPNKPFDPDAPPYNADIEADLSAI